MLTVQITEEGMDTIVELAADAVYKRVMQKLGRHTTVDPNRMLTVNDIRKLFGIPRPRVLAACDSGKLKFQLVGNRERRFRYSDVKSFLDRQIR